MSNEQSIFISHATEDHRLARAWQEFIDTVSNGETQPFYAGDKTASGGIGLEEWREKVGAALSAADNILVLLTPGSNERPWVLFESGIAHGQRKSVTPVVHFMEKTDAHDVFKAFEIFDGREKEDVYKLVELMVFGRDVPEKSRRSWDGAYEEFRESLSQERLATFTRTLFQDHFHNLEAGKKLEGVWAAKWIQVDDAGIETPFEEDALYVWSTESRIRMVGLNAKKGIEDILPGEASSYPMEGVVSSGGWIAMSYWSAGEIPISGTCLLRPKGASGRKYTGHWQGYTAKDIDDEIQFTQGRVEFVKIARETLPPREVLRLRGEMKGQ